MSTTSAKGFSSTMSTTDRVLTVRDLPRWASAEPEILVNVVDRLAKVRPSAPYIYYPVNPTSYVAGYRCVTWGIFANIINGLAHWIEEEFGPAGTDFPTLAYVGGNDVRYNGLILAANKVGYKVETAKTLAAQTTGLTFADVLHFPT